MKLSEIAERLNKSKENEDWIMLDDFAQNEFNIIINDEDQDRLKRYWVGNWYCTDSWVGYRMYFFDDKPVAFSIQRGRKCDEALQWFSEDAAMRVKQYLLSLAKDAGVNVGLCDISDDIGDSYKIYFNEQIMNHNKPTMNGEPVIIVEKIKDTQN